MATKLILLINQEAEVRRILYLCLNHLGGWNVVPVASTQEGLNKLTVQQPDVIVLDVPITKEDQGLQFIQTLRNHAQWRSIPIILIADRAKWLATQQMHQMGVCGAIAKPFNPLTLPQQITSLLNWPADKRYGA